MFRRKRTTVIHAKFSLDQRFEVDGAAGGGVTFRASAVDINDFGTQVTSYLNLYQQFRINKLKFQFYPYGVGNTTYSDTGTATSPGPILHGGRAVTVLDFEDVTLPTSVAQLERQSTAVKHSLNRPFARYFTPSVNMDAAAGQGLVPVRRRGGLWLNTTATGVQHYGLKGAFLSNNRTASDAYTIDAVLTAYVSFRYPQ